MRGRTMFSLLALSIPVVVVAACDGESSSGTTIDAGPVGVDVTTPDAPSNPSPPDSGTPDATPDASDAADAADAAPVTSLPFATGLGANGVALADGQVDPHWTVKDATGAALTSYVQTDALGYIGYWLAPSATSKFISPFVDTVDPTGSGVFTYATTFVLGPEVSLPDVELVIRYTSDNAMTAITVNGQAVDGVVGGSYSAFETVTVTTPFVRGTNTVSLTVSNSGGPTGMRAELDLTK
ncbi:MAG: hypothetical protein KF819_18220 [Labilithrix sp.]|nr:hypothetical protein [Labilithrix sp.]